MLHIDLPTRSEILKLADTRGAPCVSIYVSTTPLTEVFADVDAGPAERRRKTWPMRVAAAMPSDWVQ